MNVLQNVKKLVKYNTVSRDSNLPLVDYVAAYLEDLGIPSYRVESEDRKKSNLFLSRLRVLRVFICPCCPKINPRYPKENQSPAENKAQC